MNKRIVTIAIIVLATIMVVVFPSIYNSAHNELVVSVPIATYFADGIEEYALAKFKCENPKVNVRIVVQQDKSSPFTEVADIYILSPQFADVALLIQSENNLVLDNYISKDTKDNIWCIDLLRNAENQLVAIPLFIGVYMINNSVGIEGGGILSNTYTWRDIYNSYGKCEVLTEDFLLILTRQAEQLAFLTYEKLPSNDVLCDYLTDLKMLMKTAILLDGKYIYDSMRAIPLEHGMLCDWRQRAAANGSLYRIMPQYGQKNLTPLAIRAGVIAKSTKKAELAVEFLESFISLDAQMQLPTAGTVRVDLWAEINRQYVFKSDWAIENVQWWGMPISPMTFQQYQEAIQTGFVGHGSFQQTQELSPVLWDYISGQLSLDTTIEILTQAVIQRNE